MIEQLEQDTPIIRARLADLPNEKIEELITKLQEKRLKAQQTYEEAKKLKAQAESEKQGELLLKALEKFEKKAVTVDNGIAALEKIAKEIIGTRLALGL